MLFESDNEYDNKDEDEGYVRRSCSVCAVKFREVVFVPCGHIWCCQKCGIKFVDCPVCHKKIVKKMKFYIPKGGILVTQWAHCQTMLRQRGIDVDITLLRRRLAMRFPLGRRRISR